MQKARHTVLLQDYARMGIDTLLIPNPQCPWRVRQPKRTREELSRLQTRLPLCVCLAGRKETEASAMRFSNSYDILDVCFANLCFAFKLRWDTTELRLREATPPLIADSSRDISVKLMNSCYFMLLHLLNISSQDSPFWLARSAIWTKSTSFAAHTQLSLYCHDECRIRCAWREKISIWLQYDNIWLYLHKSIMSGNIMIR